MKVIGGFNGIRYIIDHRGSIVQQRQWRIGYDGNVIEVFLRRKTTVSHIDPIVILTNNDVLLDASVQQITERLCFSYAAAPSDAALYSEMTPQGYLNVVPNQTGDESQLNIEALFNAVLRNKAAIKELFK